MKTILTMASTSMLVLADANTLEDMQARIGVIADRLDEIVNLAESEARDLTGEELAEINTLNGEFETLGAQIEARKTISSIRNKGAKPGGRKTPTPAPTPAAKKKESFLNMGDFAQAVHRSLAPDAASVDQRLINNQAPEGDFSSALSGSDGGFLVPDDFRNEIQKKVNGEDSLLARCDQMNTASNSISVPQDNVSPWDETTGVQCYWEGEAKQYKDSKIDVDLKQQRLHKLTSLVPVTDELLEDAPLLNAYMMQKVPEKMDFKISRAILAGDGVGKPLGLWESDACVTVAKESGQADGTIVFENIINMWARLYSGCQATSVWIANQDTLPQLMNLKFPGDGRPVYLPGGVIAGAPFGTLFGRPIIFHEAAETVGQLGDLTLCDLNKYLVARKAAGIEMAQSMHLYFDYGMEAFRFTYRLGGSPWWKDAIEPRAEGGNTLGMAVVLEQRVDPG